MTLQGLIKPEWGKRMTMLDVSGNLIFHVPDVFGELAALEELIVTNNNLTKFPRWLPNLKHLRLINFNNNAIHAIPDSLNHVRELQALSLMNNKIQQIPIFIASMNKLELLEVAGNPIINLPDQIIASAKGGNREFLIFFRSLFERLAIHMLFSETGKFPLNSQEFDNEYYEGIDISSYRKRLTEEESRSIGERKKLFQENQTPPWYDSFANIKTKQLSRILEPIIPSPARVLKKVSDYLWCAREDGSIHVWDIRVSFL